MESQQEAFHIKTSIYNATVGRLILRVRIEWNGRRIRENKRERDSEREREKKDRWTGPFHYYCCCYGRASIRSSRVVTLVLYRWQREWYPANQKTHSTTVSRETLDVLYLLFCDVHIDTRRTQHASFPPPPTNTPRFDKELVICLVFLFVCLFFSKRKGKRKKNHFHVSSSFFLTKNETRTKTTSPSRPDRRRKVKRNRPRFPWWLKPSEVRSNPCRVERLPHPILAQTTFTKWVSIDALLIPKSMQDYDDYDDRVAKVLVFSSFSIFFFSILNGARSLKRKEGRKNERKIEGEKQLSGSVFGFGTACPCVCVCLRGLFFFFDGGIGVWFVKTLLTAKQQEDPLRVPDSFCVKSTRASRESRGLFCLPQHTGTACACCCDYYSNRPLREKESESGGTACVCVYVCVLNGARLFKCRESRCAFDISRFSRHWLLFTSSAPTSPS